MQATAILYNGVVVNAFVVRSVVISAGQNLAAGRVLGRVAANGEFIGRDSNANDGSQVCRAVLLEDCDATLGALEAPALFCGAVDEAALTFAVGDTLAGSFAELCDAGIYPVEALNP